MSDGASLRVRDHVERYAWGDGCSGWHLVRTPELAVIEEEMPAGTSEQWHRHQRARQFFFVTRGELVIETELGTMRLGAGMGCEVPPATRHLVRNDGHAPATFLVVSQPPSHGDREEG